MRIHLIEDCVLNNATGIFKIDINTLGRQISKRRGYIVGFIIYRAVKPQVVDKPAALLLITSNTNDVQSVCLRQLPHQRTDGSCCTTDH